MKDARMLAVIRDVRDLLRFSFEEVDGLFPWSKSKLIAKPQQIEKSRAMLAVLEGILLDRIDDETAKLKREKTSKQAEVRND